MKTKTIQSNTTVFVIKNSVFKEIRYMFLPIRSSSGEAVKNMYKRRGIGLLKEASLLHNFVIRDAFFNISNAFFLCILL